MLNENESEKNSRNIVQPDISVICDKSKLTDKGCIGSPDMIVNPMKRSILVYTLSENGYEMPDSYTFNDNIKVNIYKDLEIDFKSLSL